MPAPHNQIGDYFLPAALPLLYNTQKKTLTSQMGCSIPAPAWLSVSCQARALRESGEGEVMKIKTSMGGRMVRLLELLIYTRKFSALLVAPFRKYWLGSCPPLGTGNTERYKLLPLRHLSHALRHHVWSVLPPRLLALPHSLRSSSPSRVLPPSSKSLSNAHIWAKQHTYTKNSHYSIVYSSQRLKRASLNIHYRELVKSIMIQ